MGTYTCTHIWLAISINLTTTQLGAVTAVGGIVTSMASTCVVVSTLISAITAHSDTKLNAARAAIGSRLAASYGIACTGNSLSATANGLSLVGPTAIFALISPNGLAAIAVSVARFANSLIGIAAINTNVSFAITTGTAATGFAAATDHRSASAAKALVSGRGRDSCSAVSGLGSPASTAARDRPAC